MENKAWKQAKLTEFFSEEEIGHLLSVCQRLPLDDAIMELRPWFLARREQLELKGLLPEYAAYAVPYKIHECLQAQQPG